MNRKQIVSRLIILPMLSLVILSAAVVLVTSLFAYRNKVYSAAYDMIDHSYLTIDFTMMDIRVQQQRLITDITETPEFKSAFESGDKDKLYAALRPMLIIEEMDYGVVTDADGTVLLRTRDADVYGDNLSGTFQIKRALDGETTAYLVGRDDDPLRITTCKPVLSGSGDIAGTITIGRTLTSRGLTNRLKNQTGCELTFFDASTNVASSTLAFPSLSYIDEESRDEITKQVLANSEIYTGTLQFRDDVLLSIIYPLLGSGEYVNGMLFIGIPVDTADSEVTGFIIRTSLVSLAFIALAVVITLLTAKLVSGRLEKMETHISNRDKLFVAVNDASVLLLQIDETDDIRAPLISCMELIGLALGVDHVHLWRGQAGDGDAHQFVREYSWVSDYGKRKARTPKYLNSTSDVTELDWMDRFLRNEHISGIIAEMDESHQLLLRALEVKSIAMIPVFLEDQFWGMFSIDNIQEARHYSDDEVHILRSISLMMASIVRRHDLQNENLKVYFDALTGINNRRYFDKNMARVISSLSRAGNELGLMMIDVDFFKKYNDTYGHAAGDECLVRVAEILAQSASRVDDFVARYGGEEFVVVMPNTDKEGAEKVAKRIIDNLREAAIAHKASDVSDHVTVSIGITTGKVTQHHTAENFVTRADDLLYKSKNTGRNKYTYGVLEE